MWAALKEGITERQLAAIAHEVFWRAGTQPVFTFCATGARTSIEILPPSDYPVRPGELIRFDMGVNYRGYLSDGSVLLPVYGYRRGAPEGENYSNGFVRSTDEGATWSAPILVAAWDKRLDHAPNEMGIVELPDGRWVAIYRDQLNRDDHNSMGVFLYRSYSHDRGRTWTVGQQIFLSMGYTTAALLPDGALMVIGHSVMGMLYAVSNNAGETWDYQNVLWGRDSHKGGTAADSA